MGKFLLMGTFLLMAPGPGPGPWGRVGPDPDLGARPPQLANPRSGLVSFKVQMVSMRRVTITNLENN